MVLHTKVRTNRHTHTTFSNAVRSVEQGGSTVRIRANSRCSDHHVSQRETKSLADYLFFSVLFLQWRCPPRALRDIVGVPSIYAVLVFICACIILLVITKGCVSINCLLGYLPFLIGNTFYQFSFHLHHMTSTT